ncbi:MAG: NUDIX hydrolase [Elusimicrobia bacterium]|nr:NUDIX hydrolase [Elusimicrobiota bacterium]
MPNHIKLIEKGLCKKRLYKGGAVNFNVDKVLLPNRKTANREYLDHPGAVAVLPVLPNGNILMVRQYRYPVGEATWEIPAGKMHGPKDSPALRARCELQEETGYTVSSLSKLITFWPCCAFSNERLHIYQASGLKPGPASPDDDEFLRPGEFSLKRAMAMVRSGRIKDSKTIIALQALALSRR